MTPTDPMLFLIVLTYKVPLTEIDAVIPAHRAYLDQHFATGEFLASGPREPRIGGVILARAGERSRIDELIAADPFSQGNLATYDVVAFTPNRGRFAPLLLDAHFPDPAAQQHR